MSTWDDFDIEARVIEALETVPVVNELGHHYGMAWVTTYQLAIKVDELNPGLVTSLTLTVGGVGTGKQVSLAQYLAKQLSEKIKRSEGGYPVEGAFLSGVALSHLQFKTPDGEPVTSSVTGTGYDLSLFRMRAASA
ncbi:hypothetical protein AB0P21_38855 [Kribbella sp. NPDC056861]|uniref:hypothetical protein n=1 Tax=Kribbella sp. NPDC056861 TaxID=3154857 RepID=UPI0034492C4E